MFLTPTQQANRQAILDYLDLKDEDAVPVARESRRSITAHCSPEEHALLDYVAKACGFRGPGPLLLLILREFERRDFPMPKVAVPKVPGSSKKKSRRKKG